MSRESYEESARYDLDEWSVLDTCKHGLYPGEDSCQYPDAPAVLIAQWEKDGRVTT